MGYYPIFMEMHRRRVLLVGGGNVANEKLGKLVDAGAAVTIVAPELIPAVRAFVDADDAEWRDRAYEPGDVKGFELVMVATDDGAVNASVAVEARARGIWVNAADDVANCDFILPSLAKRGRIAIAASTGGASPALARWLRERLEEFLSDEVVALGDLLAGRADAGARARSGVRSDLRAHAHAAAAALREVPEPDHAGALAGGDRRPVARTAARRRARAGPGAPRRFAGPGPTAHDACLGVMAERA